MMPSIYSILRNFIREKFRQRRAKDTTWSVLRDLPRDSAYMDAMKQKLDSLSIRRNLIRDLMAAGHRQHRAKNFTGAIDSYTQALQHNPLLVSAHIGRARAHIGDKNTEAAKHDLSTIIAHYNASIPLHAYDMESYFHRGMALASLGKNVEAIGDIQEWIDLNRNYYRSRFDVIWKAGPSLVENMGLSTSADCVDWYDMWDKIRYEVDPIESLIMDLWDEDQTTVDEAIAELGRIGEPALIPLLMQLQKDDRNSEVDIYENNDLRRAIAAIGQPAILSLYQHILKDTSLNRAAAKTLYWFDDPLAEELLKQALDNPKVSDYIKDYIRSSLSMIEMRKQRDQ